MGLRSLIIFTPRPHDDIRRGCLCDFVTLIRIFTLRRFLKESHRRGSHAAHVSASVGRYNTEQALTSFFRKIGLFEHARGGVDVGKVESRARMAGVEYCGEPDTGLKGLDHDTVHLVIDDMACAAEVDGVDYFVVAVFFIAVEIWGLAAVPYNSQSRVQTGYEKGFT